MNFRFTKPQRGSCNVQLQESASQNFPAYLNVYCTIKKTLGSPFFVQNILEWILLFKHSVVVTVEHTSMHITVYICWYALMWRYTLWYLQHSFNNETTIIWINLGGSFEYVLLFIFYFMSNKYFYIWWSVLYRILNSICPISKLFLNFLFFNLRESLLNCYLVFGASWYTFSTRVQYTVAKVLAL